jgi:hypothetical protein
MPAFEKLVSFAASGWRSTTTTSWPSEASAWAVVTPTIPPPSTAIFTFASLD